MLTDDQLAGCAMTPEQENELVARWMGWNKRSYPDPPMQASVYWDRRVDERQWIMVPPNYRADFALLWELLERLSSYPHWWVFELYGEPSRCEALNFNSEMVVKPTLAEAVFAAAVMQATEDKETRDE